MGVQLPLGLSLPQTATFAAFVAGDNALLVSLMQQMCHGESEKQLYFWGESGIGKTHLLQACCHFAAENHFSVAYLPLKELKDYGPEILDDLQQLKLICIDDLHVVAGERVWEKGLFSLINQVRASQSRLIMSGPAPVSALGVELKDLVSRLTWGPVFNVKTLSDSDKVRVLQRRASEQGLVLSDEVVNFMLSRYDRNITSLCNLLSRLDQAAMVAQRRLTVPFVRSVLDDSKSK